MRKKVRLKIGIVLVIIGLIGFSDWTFAAESSDDFEFLGFGLNAIISSLAWLWVFFAKIAGTFLTNKWVYGEGLGLDTLFWKFWNIIKNIANFGLGFYFIYVIFRGLIKQGKEDITKKIKDIILWILIAGVGIQASWFLTAAVIDVSTITLSAAGAFPSQLISGSPRVQEDFKQSLNQYFGVTGDVVNMGTKIELAPQNQAVSGYLSYMKIKLNKPAETEQLIDEIMPNSESVSGPLYFIGFSILQTNDVGGRDSSSSQNIKSSIFKMIIKGGTTIVFAIEMLVLCVLALMRIVYLRMFIVLSPIAILIRCIEQSGQKLGSGDKSFLSGFTKHLNFESFFINVFKPTIIVLLMGISTIFVVLMNGVINSSKKTDNFDLNGVTFSSEKKGDSYTSKMDSNLVEFTLVGAGRTLLEFILSILTVILVYQIIKFAMKMGGGKDFVSEKIGKFQDSVSNAMTSLPMIPVSAYDEKGRPTTKYITAGTALGLGGKPSLAQIGIDRRNRKIETISAEQQDNVLEGRGLLDEKGLSQAMRNRIRTANGKTGWEKLVEQKSIISGIKTPEGLGMTLNPNASDNFWIKEFENWLTEMKDKRIPAINSNGSAWEEMINKWNDENNKPKDLKSLFESDKYGNYVKAYASFFGLQGVENWNDLISKDISSENDTNGNSTPKESENESEKDSEKGSEENANEEGTRGQGQNEPQNNNQSGDQSNNQSDQAEPSS